jgi:hemerythrin-like metal-binding protein
MTALCLMERPMHKALIQWDDKRFTIGVRLIDAQHRTLVGLLNRTHAAMQEDDSFANLRAILEELQQYVLIHFRTEEDLMQLHGYPLTPAHEAEHDHLRMRTEQLLESCLHGNTGVADQTLMFLRDWLITHILKVDMDLGRHLNGAGIY